MKRIVQTIVFGVALVSGVLGCLFLVFTKSKPSKSSDYHWVNAMTEMGSPSQLQVVPPTIADGGSVTIFWKGIIDATPFDVITISCGPAAGYGDIIRNVSCGSPAPSGAITITGLHMLRCDYTFRYVSFNPSMRVYQVLTEITVPMHDSFNAPKQGHIALTSKIDEMAIMYNSASIVEPHVRYGFQSGVYSYETRGTTTTYTANDMCQAPANIVSQVYFRDPGFSHRVVISKLEPGTRYFYQFGNEIDGWSKEYTFKSPPELGVKSVKFLAYGDMGVFPSSARTAKLASALVSDGYDGFLLHFGDLSYALGQGAIWDQFFAQIEPYATRVPYMIGIGNHEYCYSKGGERDPSGIGSHVGFHPPWGNHGEDSFGECSVPVFHRFSAPDNGNSIYWYSFNNGGVHVIQMSTEHEFSKGSPQYLWIQQDLANVNREITPWIVLTAHRMMYSTETNQDSDILLSIYFRQQLEELLYRYEVNLMLVGHQHSYERSCQVYNGQCLHNGRGTVHITVGSAGFPLDHAPFSTQLGQWSLVSTNEYGLLRVDANEHRMIAQFVLSKNGQIYDETTLYRWPQ